MNFPRIESTALLVVDLQERLVPAMNNPGPVLDRSRDSAGRFPKSRNSCRKAALP